MSTRSLIASTLRLHESEIADNITKDIVLFKLFGDKDLAPKLFKMKKPEAGAKFAEGIKLHTDPGRSIVRKIRKARNGTVEAYERFDVIDTSPQDNFDEVEMPWKSIAGSCNLANEDLDKNSGSKTKIFDLLEASMDDLQISEQEKTTEYLLGQRPADAIGLKRPSGLLDWVQDDPTTLPVSGSSAIGGIDASLAANSFWRNQVQDMAAAAFGTDQTGTGHSKLRQLLVSCRFGMMRPMFLYAGEDAYLALQKSMVSQMRVTNYKVDTLAEANIDAIVFDGLPVVLDRVIDEVRQTAALNGSAIYALHVPTLRIDGMAKRWFKFGDFRAPTNQDSQVALMITRLQMTCNSRRNQGVLFNVV